jgi:hypothetical protein
LTGIEVAIDNKQFFDKQGQSMTIHKFAIADAPLERSPGQEGDIFAGNVLDQRHGGPVTIVGLTDTHNDRVNQDLRDFLSE